MKKVPKVLVIAGSDSGAGAGIQADIKSIAANGAYATTAITSITSQNTIGVQAISDVPLAAVESQIISVLQDIGADVIKTGMLSNKNIISLVSGILDKYKIKLVLDPVMVAKGGAKLLRDDAISALKNKLISKAFLITPNIPEAEVISGMKIKNIADMEKAATKIISKYKCNAVLIKGGHMEGKILTDILIYKNKITKLTAVKTKTKNTHGTGCTYASAIAANIAKGEKLEYAVKHAHAYLQGAIKGGYKIGKGHNPVNHFWNS